MISRHERLLSLAAWIGGFVFDNYAFGRVDHPATQIVLVVYILVAAASIAWLHYIESHVERAHLSQRPYTIVATQFALGGLWSAFLIFYARSAILFASWPFLLLLVAIFVGNEIFRHYHSRLAFTCVLFFFALTSYAIFVVPVFSKTIGQETFLVSGALAVCLFVGFLAILRAIDKPRLYEAMGRILAGAGGILLIINVLYFTNILPPLPMALSNAGVFHSVRKVGETYEAVGETQPWYASLGFNADVHITPGERLFVYSAVFAPVDLKTRVTHVWQRYDEASQSWITQSTVPLDITGGREGGYRLYSIKSNVSPGRWRVDIDSVDGRLIGRVGFKVTAVTSPASTFLRIFD